MGRRGRERGRGLVGREQGGGWVGSGFLGMVLGWNFWRSSSAFEGLSLSSSSPSSPSSSEEL